MAWTYNASMPTDKDKVRWLVGDTDENDPLVQNEEIEFALTLESNDVYKAGATVCRAFSARLRRELTLDPSPGSVSLDSQKQADGFLDLAAKLDAKAATGAGGAAAGVFAGGISRRDKQTRSDDSDRVQPAFDVT